MTNRPRAAPALLAAGLALVMLLGSSSLPSAFAATSQAGTGGTPEMFLRLKSAVFDPLTDGVDWVPSGYRLAAIDPYGDLFVVQFTDKVQAGQREQMLSLGAAYHSYLPDNAFLIAATSQVVAGIKALSFVRAVVPWEPYFRIAEDLKTSAWRAQAGPATIKVENFGDPSRLIAFATSRGATFVIQDGVVTTLIIPRSMLTAIASLPTVAFITAWEPRQLDNYLSSVIQGARQVPDGAYNPASMRLWSFNPATGQYEGTTGAGVIVAVSDTGLDTTHPAFNGKVVLFDPMGDPAIDTFGHGTHTSGTVLGSGAWRASDAGIAVPGRFAGIAPGAKLVHENIFASGSSNARAALDNGQTGAVISSGSWANGGGYGSDARQYDGFARDSWPDGSNASSVGEQGVLYFFSAGNAGGSSTIGNPAEGKNVIAVGATGDNKGTSWDTMASFSSRGPADDNRIKPDLVTPGVDVMSTYCPTCSMPVGSQQGTSYGEQSGTSMSCPGAAGAAAVAWQYYRDHIGSEPTPDMVKAILINGVDEMANYPVLGPDQGFGRMNLSTSLLPLSNRQQIWMDRPASLSTGDERVWTYGVADSLQPFVVTLAWLDQPGDTAASPEIVNDLDLWVVGPGGQIFRGNVMDDKGTSLANGIADNRNTVEKVKITVPTRGYYEVHVKGSNVPVGPQDFSLAIRGNMVTDWYDIILEKVETNASFPIEGNVVSFNATVWNRGTQWVNGSAVTLEANTAQGVLPVGTFNPGSIAPGARFAVQTNWTTVRGNVSFVARVAAPLGQTEFSATNNQANTSFFVRGYGYTLATNGQSSYAVNPGDTLSLTFNVTSTANALDNVTASLTWDNPSVSAFLDYTRVTLKAGEWKPFHLTVIIPQGAKAGERVNITFATRSLADGRFAQSFSTYAVVNHLYGFSSGLLIDSVTLPPTGSATSQVTIENRGNGWDTFDLSAIGIPGGWTFEFSPTGVTLNDNASTTLSISIRAPDRADAGAHFQLAVRVGSFGALPQSHNFTLTVSQVYGWTAFASGPPGEVRSGTIIDVPIAAQNLGNGVDEIAIDLTVPPGWHAVLTRPRLVMLPYENASSMATITIDHWALAGSYSMRLTYGGARNFTTQTIPLQVKMEYLLQVDGPGYTLQMGQGEVNTFEVTVINQGNGPAPVNPVVFAPDGVTIISVVPGALLERNATAKFTFQVIVSRTAVATLRNFTVDLRSGEGGSISNPLEMHIDVHELVEPTPTDTGGSTKDTSALIPAILGVVVVVAVAMPVGYLYLRRKAARNAPPPQIIVQSQDDANAGGYDPTQGYAPGAAPAAVPVAPRAPRAPAGSSAMSFVATCKNCGGAVMDLGNGMGRCRSCGVEQIVRPGKR